MKNSVTYPRLLMRFRFLLILCIALFTSLLPAECRGEALLRAAFPYSLTKEAGVAHAGSTQLLYISVQNFGNEEEAAEITAALPEGFTALVGDDGGGVAQCGIGF